MRQNSVYLQFERRLSGVGESRKNAFDRGENLLRKSSQKRWFQNNRESGGTRQLKLSCLTRLKKYTSLKRHLREKRSMIRRRTNKQSKYGLMASEFGRKVNNALENLCGQCLFYRKGQQKSRKRQKKNHEAWIWGRGRWYIPGPISVSTEKLPSGTRTSICKLGTYIAGIL